MYVCIRVYIINILELTHQVTVSEKVPERAQKALEPLGLLSGHILLSHPIKWNQQARPHKLVKGEQSVDEVESTWNLRAQIQG